MKVIEKRLPRDIDTLELFPISDLHIGSQDVDTKMFDTLTNYILSDNNKYIILNGDNMNNALKSSVSNVYNETMSPMKQKKWLVEKFMPLKDRIISIVPGNHEYRTEKDTDNDIVEDFAMMLGLEDIYRKEEAFIKLTFGEQNNNVKNPQIYTIYHTHGNGGGKLPGGTLNNLERLCMSTNSDIYIVGHSHKKIAYKNSYRHFDAAHSSVTYRERLFVCSSAWQDFAGYAARKMLTPSAKGSVPITLYAKEKRMEAVV